tara:strand:+ start:3345 stop:4022 length:678 start_codon:yes stop_codon:yes gene_type:complete
MEDAELKELEELEELEKLESEIQQCVALLKSKGWDLSPPPGSQEEHAYFEKELWDLELEREELPGSALRRGRPSHAKAPDPAALLASITAEKNNLQQIFNKNMELLQEYREGKKKMPVGSLQEFRNKLTEDKLKLLYSKKKFHWIQRILKKSRGSRDAAAAEAELERKIDEQIKTANEARAAMLAADASLPGRPRGGRGRKTRRKGRGRLKKAKRRTSKLRKKSN